jgi:hypothetical protein
MAESQKRVPVKLGAADEIVRAKFPITRQGRLATTSSLGHSETV